MGNKSWANSSLISYIDLDIDRTRLVSASDIAIK